MKYSRWQRWAILFVGLFENLIFSGSILGWSALNYMLKQEGIFSSLCHHDTSILSFSAQNESRSGVNQPNLIVSWNDSNSLLNSFINYSMIPEMLPKTNMSSPLLLTSGPLSAASIETDKHLLLTSNEGSKVSESLPAFIASWSTDDSSCSCTCLRCNSCCQKESEREKRILNVDQWTTSMNTCLLISLPFKVRKSSNNCFYSAGNE